MCRYSHWTDEATLESSNLDGSTGRGNCVMKLIIRTSHVFIIVQEEVMHYRIVFDVVNTAHSAKDGSFV
jgi:hypothetical protein